MSDQIKRMMGLFISNERSIGKYDPKTGKMHTDYRSLEPKDFEQHFSGRMGIGAVPILDDDTCRWAAIDIDNHDQEDDIPIGAIDEAIRANNLPLVPCRSKSGGVHAYLFLSEPVAASKIRDLMTRWSALLGYAGSEVFPKQVKLVGTGGKRMLGNWINLPYMFAPDTERYCIRSGRRLNLEEFLDHAEKMRVSQDGLTAVFMAEHADAPPCIQHMLMNGVEKGRRNDAMYNTVVYLRKKDGDDYGSMAVELNRYMFDHPLPKQELSRTITSAGKPGYTYRCHEEPIRSRCDRALCLKRKYGVTDKELERADAQSALPEFSDLVQLGTDPPRWEVTIDGKHRVSGLSTEDLLDFRQVRVAILNKLLRVVPQLQPKEWERMLSGLMESVRKVEAPDDASAGGIVREKLRDFCARVDLSSQGYDTADRKALLRGIPVVQAHNGQRMVMFRGSDFMQYLKRTKSEVLRDVSMWLAIRKLGSDHVKLRVGERTIYVWAVPVNVFEGDTSVEAPEFTTEL